MLVGLAAGFLLAFVVAFIGWRSSTRVRRLVRRLFDLVDVAPPDAGPMMVSLSSFDRPERWSVGVTPLLVGRDVSCCNIPVRESATDVSRQHCAVWWDAFANGYRVRDEGSANGTFLDDGTPCSDPDGTVVAPGSVIYLGSRSVRFRLARFTATASNDV